MYNPVSTYRVQLHAAFKFTDLAKIIDYLSQLGISTVYGAPFFGSRPGSVHGYDVTDPLGINPEVGTLEQFQSLTHQLREKNMGWIQDMVPNHMAFDAGNAWLMDIFEKGPSSPYYRFFDIDWASSEGGKVLAPFLGGELDELLAEGEIRLAYRSSGFVVEYFDLAFPLAWLTYADILAYGIDFMETHHGANAQIYHLFRELLTDLQFLQNQPNQDIDVASGLHCKELLHQYAVSHNLIKEAIDAAIRAINTNTATLSDLLDRQFFRLCHWQTTESRINYRRFFTINDLLCLRMEDDTVFDQYHTFIRMLVDEGLVQGLRIDHIDGLYNPTGYLEKLRQSVGKDTYLIVEKILESEEALPNQWPVQGTSGYEFLSCVNRALTEDSHQEQLDDTYRHFVQAQQHYDDLVFEKKRFILLDKMGGELHNLTCQLVEIRPELAYSYAKEALTVWLASFPVYRVYPTQLPLNPVDARVVERAFEAAEKRDPSGRSAFEAMRSLFLSSEPTEEALTFLMRLQQFSGPLAAKGVEDTVFYLYNRLISHNEVGDSPHLLGSSVAAFHQRMQERQQQTPLSINATATHDTKRGEDARMRINMLSEIPDEWQEAVFAWKEINRKRKTEREGRGMPDENDEYFIYQALLGGYPMEGYADETFRQRLSDYLVKVVREAKTHSDWSKPDAAYEKAVTDFVSGILNNQEFMQSFLALFEKVRTYGILYSLAQTLLKVTAPGIPDVYQGCEWWDLSFVDPDNRRKVDFEARQLALSQIQDRLHQNKDAFIQELTQEPTDARIKLFTLYQALQARRSQADLFAMGEYVPLTLSGDRAAHVIAFARCWQEQWALVIVPKSIVQVSTEEAFGMGGEVWGNTALVLPEGAPQQWKNRLTDREYQLRGVETHAMASDEAESGDDSFPHLPLRELLETFPVALLFNH
jgi:(1->4)-alpha-D-glucan 1-alpha-D-glucosylmutase